MSRKRYLIVGDGAAGFTAAQALRSKDRDATIAILTDDASPAYFRAALTNYLLGELREDQIWAVPPDFYESWGIHRVFTRVLGVDAGAARVTLSTGGPAEAYDGLLVASGSRARTPTFEGAHLPGVMTMRTVQDVRRVLERVHNRATQQAVVLGGGALGLEWAHGLLEHGVKVTILERAPQFLPGVLDKVGSDLLASRLSQAGIDVRLGEEATGAYAARDGTVAGVGTSSGQTLWCQLVACAIGVECNSELLVGSGAQLSDRGAVIADRQMRTALPGVWAAGDVAQVEGDLRQLWEPARQQGRIAGSSMAATQTPGSPPDEYSPGAQYFATRLFDLDFAVIGRLDGGDDERVDLPRGTGSIAYRKLVFRNGQAIGGIFLGERDARVRRGGRAYKRLVDSRMDVSAIKDQLLQPDFDVEGWLRTKSEAAPMQPAAGGAGVVGAKVRRTQAVALAPPQKAASGDLDQGEGLGARIVAGTVAVQLPEGPPATPIAMPDAAPSHWGPKPSTVALPRQAPRKTRALSIGLPAEAPAPAAPASSTPSAIDARLESTSGNWPITGMVTSIGSDPESTIALQDASVSQLHAQILRFGEGLFLRDLGSQAGTWVNGSPLTNAHRLGDGDTIVIGGVQMVFRSSSLGANVPSRAAAGPRQPRLEIRSGAWMGLSFALKAGTALVGRAPEAAVRLDDTSIGWHHANIREYGGAHYLSHLPGPHVTWKGGVALAAGQEVALAEGEVVRFGQVDVAYTTAPMRATFAMALRPKATLHVDAGSLAGRAFPLADRVVIGSQNGSTIQLSDGGVLPSHLEIVLGERGFALRDLSGGSTFLRGAPVGRDNVPLTDGDVMLLGSGVMLRFEETP